MQIGIIEVRTAIPKCPDHAHPLVLSFEDKVLKYGCPLSGLGPRNDREFGIPRLHTQWSPSGSLFGGKLRNKNLIWLSCIWLVGSIFPSAKASVSARVCKSLTRGTLRHVKPAKPWAVETMSDEVGGDWKMRASLFLPNGYFALVFGSPANGGKVDALASLKKKLFKSGWISCGSTGAPGVVAQKTFHGYPIVARVVRRQTFVGVEGLLDSVQVMFSPSEFTEDIE